MLILWDRMVGDFQPIADWLHGSYQVKYGIWHTSMSYYFSHTRRDCSVNSTTATTLTHNDQDNNNCIRNRLYLDSYQVMPSNLYPRSCHRRLVRTGRSDTRCSWFKGMKAPYCVRYRTYHRYMSTAGRFAKCVPFIQRIVCIYARHGTFVEAVSAIPRIHHFFNLNTSCSHRCSCRSCAISMFSRQ